MTNKEMLNNISNVKSGEMIANNCYDNLIMGTCCGSCSECFTKWLDSEVHLNETSTID